MQVPSRRAGRYVIHDGTGNYPPRKPADAVDPEPPPVFRPNVPSRPATGRSATTGAPTKRPTSRVNTIPPRGKGTPHPGRTTHQAPTPLGGTQDREHAAEIHRHSPALMTPSTANPTPAEGPDHVVPTRADEAVAGGLPGGPGRGHVPVDSAGMGHVTGLRLLPTPTGDRSWRDSAACAGSTDEVADAVFFPAGKPGRPTAGQVDVWGPGRRVCGGCPVAGDCLTFAMGVETPGSRAGMFGGLSPDERDELTGSVKVPGDLVEAPETPQAGGAKLVCPDCKQFTTAEAHTCTWTGHSHGTKTGYVTRRCRCEACKAWNRRRRQKQAMRIGWRGELRTSTTDGASVTVETGEAA